MIEPSKGREAELFRRRDGLDHVHPRDAEEYRRVEFRHNATPGASDVPGALAPATSPEALAQQAQLIRLEKSELLVSCFIVTTTSTFQRSRQ